MPRVARWVERRAIPFLCLGIVVLAVGVVVNTLEIVAQANAGEAAHARQCMLAPTFRKIVEAAYHYDLIERADLDAYLYVGLPTGCPPRTELLRELKVK